MTSAVSIYYICFHSLRVEVDKLYRMVRFHRCPQLLLYLYCAVRYKLFLAQVNISITNDCKPFRTKCFAHDSNVAVISLPFLFNYNTNQRTVHSFSKDMQDIKIQLERTLPHKIFTVFRVP